MLLLLPAVIFAHELGHYSVARALGVGVLEFSLGAPSAEPLYSTYIGPTRFVMHQFPFLQGHVLPASQEVFELLMRDQGSPLLKNREALTELLERPNQWFDGVSSAGKILVYSAGIIVEMLIGLLLGWWTVRVWRRFQASLASVKGYRSPQEIPKSLAVPLLRQMRLASVLVLLTIFYWLMIYSHLWPEAGMGGSSDSYKIVQEIAYWWRGDRDDVFERELVLNVQIAHTLGQLALAFFMLFGMSRFLKPRS